MMLPEVKHPGVSMVDLDRFYLKTLLIALTDAKSLEASLNKDAGQPAEKRVKILISQVKEFLGGGSYDNDGTVCCHWCDTSQMLAEVLTKAGCEREPLLHALSTGMWCLQATEENEAKQKIREGRHRRKAVKKLTAAGEDGCETNCM